MSVPGVATLPIIIISLFLFPLLQLKSVSLPLLPSPMSCSFLFFPQIVFSVYLHIQKLWIIKHLASVRSVFTLFQASPLLISL